MQGARTPGGLMSWLTSRMDIAAPECGCSVAVLRQTLQGESCGTGRVAWYRASRVVQGESCGTGRVAWYRAIRVVQGESRAQQLNCIVLSLQGGGGESGQAVTWPGAMEDAHHQGRAQRAQVPSVSCVQHRALNVE